MRARRTPTRQRPSRLALVSLLALAGCGGGGGDAAPPPGPGIQRATADQLAATSDAIADALDNGDVCGAAGLADQLNDQVIDAINARRIPPAFQEELQSRANELVNTVNCPSPTVEEDDEEEKKPKQDKKKEKQEEQEDQEEQEESDDEPVPTEPLPTVPEDDQ